MTTVILRIVEDGKGGLRGTAEIPGEGFRTFQSDEDLLDTLYEWSEPDPSPGNGSGSTSSSAIRVT